MTAKTVLGLRVSDELREALEELAEKDRRTLSQYAVLALEDHIRAKRSTAPKRVKESQR